MLLVILKYSVTGIKPLNAGVNIDSDLNLQLKDQDNAKLD